MHASVAKEVSISAGRMVLTFHSHRHGMTLEMGVVVVVVAGSGVVIHSSLLPSLDDAGVMDGTVVDAWVRGMAAVVIVSGEHHNWWGAAYLSSPLALLWSIQDLEKKSFEVLWLVIIITLQNFSKSCGKTCYQPAHQQEQQVSTLHQIFCGPSLMAPHRQQPPPTPPSTSPSAVNVTTSKHSLARSFISHHWWMTMATR